jgi:hypothetical protein
VTLDRLPIRYRPACDCDLPAMVGMNGLLPKEDRYPVPVLAYIQNQRTCRTFVAETKGIVGIVIAHKLRGQTGEILLFDVDRECLDSDIAPGLLFRAETWLREQGARAIFVETPGGSAQFRMCRDLGYFPPDHAETEAAERPHLLMRKLLS